MVVLTWITRDEKIRYILQNRHPIPGAIEGTRAGGKRLAGKDNSDSLAEVMTLQKGLEELSEADLEKAYVEAYYQVRERQEAARAFNQPYARANFEHWARCAYWSIEESVALVLGREPKFANWEILRPFADVSTFVQQFDRINDLAHRAVTWDQLTKPTGPGAFIAWAKRYDISVPAELEAAVANYGHFVGDWKTLYDTAKLRLDEALAREIEVAKVAFALNQEMETLKERVASLPPPAPASARPEKPADPREIESLRTLLIAMGMRGYKYDPKEKRSDKIADIVADVESLGLSLDRDTVRRHLKAAAELVPPEAFEKPKK